MKLSALILLGLSLSVFAKEKATHQSLAEVMEEIRDPVFTSAQRRQMLDFSRRMMTSKLAAEFGVSAGELNLAFMKNPTRASQLLRDPWYDAQTQFYTTLHQENFYQRWIGLQKLVKFSPYGKGLNATMMAHWGQYSPVKEGRFYARWHKMSVKIGTQTRSFNVPYFLMSQNTQDLISMEAHVPYSELMAGTEYSTFLKSTQTLTKLVRQELAEKMVLNKNIYIRAVANAAKTVASIHYLTGSANRVQTERKVSAFMDGHCSGCSVSEKREYVKGAMIYVDNMKKTMSVGSTADVVKNFCSSLKSNHYYWNPDRLKPTPVDILIDQTKLVNYYTVHKLKEKNKVAIAKTILAQDMGILFLTSAINILDKTQEPVGTKLGCTPQSAAKDNSLVVAAINEAENNIESYVLTIGRKLQQAKFKLSETNSTLDYFVQTNQAATIEATAGYPQGIGWVLKTVAELDQNASRRKKTDKIIAWGGTILGVGLTLTGIGAPEGVAILVSAASVVKGVSAGSYFLVRAQQEKNFAREMRIAKSGSSGLNDALLRNHYKEYKSLKVSYIKEFAGSAISFINLHRLALKQTNGDIAKAHTVLKRVVETAKETGKDEAIGKLQEMVIEVAVSL